MSCFDVFTELIRSDMKPALGVTEPGAIAFAVASAREVLGCMPEKVLVRLNSGMYKNAYTCGIPNSPFVGNLYAAALGAVSADASLGLESLANITEDDNAKAQELVKGGCVTAQLSHISSTIYIEAKVRAKGHWAAVYITGSHTHIACIMKDGAVLQGAVPKIAEEASSQEDVPALIHQHSFSDILSYVNKVPAEDLAFIRDAFSMNHELLLQGLASDRALFTARLYESNGSQLISGDLQKMAQLYSSGAIEARVIGLSKPAMSITGSGAHGIIATMPLYAVYQAGRCTEEQLLRAAALSCLVCMYIKEYSGRLSAFCGCGIAAGTGMACGLAYLQGADENTLAMVIRNMASGITGMICDGGNQGCTMKSIVAVDAAFRAVDFALKGIAIDSCHGINGASPEETMRSMGRIASPGMVKTEEVIVEIMRTK
ncbi:MAG: serine dehydratase subunit alpha family protein [Firmicutes bacterium]|nr:serine dehydratase subunit alpha family protein [Bacillota bacterium]